MPSSGELHRILSVKDGLAVTVGIVIGAGILRTPGLIAGYLGNPLVILGVWFLGGVVVMLSTLVLAEMAAALPEAGGKFVYAREAYGRTAGFLAGWSELLVTRGFSGAAKAVVIAEYVVLLLGRGSVPLLAAAVVAGFYLLHSGGLRFGRGFQNVTTVAKVMLLLALCAAGLIGGDGSGFLSSMVLDPEYAGLLGFALAYQAVAFAYYGWEDAAKMAEETHDPGRNLPRILVGGAMAVAVMYLLINAAFLNVLTPGEMAGSQLVAADVLGRSFGVTAASLITVASLVIVLSSLNVNFLGMPRVALGLAREGLAPARFARVGKSGTPGAALAFVSITILALALTGAFEFLIRFMMTVAITVDLLVLSGIFRLRRTQPNLKRPLRVPFYPWLPAITLALHGAVLAIIVYTQPTLALGAAGIIGVLFVTGWFVARRGDGSRS
jgi:APA family basic amino acid/polyamine antiporter